MMFYCSYCTLVLFSLRGLSVYINKVWWYFWTLKTFQNVKYWIKMNVFLVNVLREMKKYVPLHPLSGTKFFGSDWKRVHWKIYIDSSSTRADALVFMRWARLGRTLRTVGSPRSLLLKMWVTGTGEWNYDRFGCSSWWDNAARHKTFSVWGFSFGDSLDAQTFYNGEFDPGSGWTLATGLTHASRGAAWGLLAIPDGDRRTGE